MLKGSFVELSAEGTVKDNGITVAESTIYLEFMKDEDTKKQFIGLKQGDTISFNLAKAYPNNVELATILHKKKEEVGDITSDFQFAVATISKFEKAEVNQELFNKIHEIITPDAVHDRLRAPCCTFTPSVSDGKRV
jgi:trigger factor